MTTYCGKNEGRGHNEVATCGKPYYGTDAYQCSACVTKERDSLRAEVETLREDAARYRFVSELAWYVEAAARTYNLCNVNARWHDQRGSPDRDDVEEQIDRERRGETELEDDQS